MGGGGGLSEDEDLGKAYNHRVVMRLARYISPYKGYALISFFAMLLYTLTIVAAPWIIKYGIDSFVEEGNLSGLNWVALFFLANAFLNWGSNYIQMLSMAKVGQGVLYDLRTGMFAHLQKLSMSFFDRMEVGRIMSRVQNDVQALQQFLELAILTVGDILSLGGIVAAMLVLQWQLGLSVMTVIPMLFIIMIVWQRYARISFMRVRRAIAVVNGDLQENISGVRVVQSLNREGVNQQIFDQKNTAHLDANLQASRLSAMLQPVVEILTAISMGMVIVIGGIMVSNDTLAVGALIAFVMYIQRFFDPIRSLTREHSQLQRAMTSGIRIFELLDVEPELKDAPDAKELPTIRGEVKFENVTFGYVPGIDVLKDIDLHVKPGETVALVGPTGAGKTSTVALAARFYDVREGRVLVDGYDVHDVTRESLARQMSMVLQEPLLFSVSIGENIRYNRRSATNEAVERAARAVGAHDFIMRLEQGYDTVLQERGGNLSVGQRQLISFARAVVADPRILILDEATANIDSYTEMLIQRALRQLLEGRTAIVIAHRLSTIRDADKIVVLDQGRIVEVGTHHELMAKEGLYAQLYAMNYAVLESATATADGDGS